MSDDANSVRAAVVQASPLFFDREGSIDKVIRMTREAAESGAGLVLFPEAFVGGYPWGLAFGTAVGGRSPAGTLPRKPPGRERALRLTPPPPGSCG